MEIAEKRFDELSTAELYAILRLRAEVFVVEQACAYADVDGQDPAATHLMAWEGPRLRGYLRWYQRGDRVAIGRVVTAPVARGQGLARRLMARAITRLDGQPLVLDAQTYLVDFYGSLGFEAVGEVFLEDGIPHQRMERG